MQIYWHHGILNRWWSWSYIYCIAGHQACVQSWPFWEAFELYWKMHTEKSRKKLQEQFWLVPWSTFLVSVWVTLFLMEGLVLNYRKCGPKYATKYNLLCQYYGPFPVAPYTILANCIFTPLPRAIDCKHYWPISKFGFHLQPDQFKICTLLVKVNGKYWFPLWLPAYRKR